MFYTISFRFSCQFVAKTVFRVIVDYDCHICRSFFFVQIFLSHHAEKNETK